jgi:hypothetical protein
MDTSGSLMWLVNLCEPWGNLYSSWYNLVKEIMRLGRTEKGNRGPRPRTARLRFKADAQPPTERTEVRVLYTKGEIYFGISCRDSEPGKVVATQLRRDVSQELDDYFEIVIDSSRNRRNAYVFQFNPLGTQRDALITDEQSPQDDGSDGDSGWDGVWISEGRITSQGWTATVAIPEPVTFPRQPGPQPERSSGHADCADEGPCVDGLRRADSLSSCLRGADQSRCWPTLQE